MVPLDSFRKVLLVVIALLASVSMAAERQMTAVDPLSGDRIDLPADASALHLFFFATWCRPCLDQLPALIDLEARWQAEGYSLVLVAVPTRQDRVRLHAFMEEESPPGTVLLDRGGELLARFGVDGIPHHVLLGPRGKVAEVSGPIDGELMAEIMKLVGESRP